MEISKPVHNRYILFCLDEDSYKKYATVYSGCKYWGVHGSSTFLGVIELFGQLLPENKDGHYTSWSNIPDLIDNLPVIGDY